MGRKYKGIICDLGNVLIDFDHRIAVKKIAKYTSLCEQDIYDLFFDSPFTAEYEEGTIDSRIFFDKVKTALSLEIGYEGFFAIWDDIFFETPLNKKLQNYLREIRPFYKMAMVSNINERHFVFLRPRMEIFSLFDVLVLSYEGGARKPKPAIYEKAFSELGLARKDILYIDDRRDLIEAAGGIGIDGIVFDGEGALKEISLRLNKTLPASSG